MKKSGLRIYIAEDEALIRISFRIVIQEMGHIVVGEASDGQKAAEDILNVKPDLILMDVNMPSLDGLAALRLINQDLVIPCIIITGHFSNELVEEANVAGAFGYLIKPIDEKQLKAAIEIAMTRFEEFQQLKQETGNLRTALEERKHIEKAKGILMERFGLSDSEAMRSLQKRSRDRNKKLVLIAKDIIQAEQLLGN